MPKNPLKKRSRPTRITDRAGLAAGALREAAETVRGRADSLASGLSALSPPKPEPKRRPFLIGGVLVAAAAIAYAIRRAAGGSSDLPSPSVTPTAPAGPTDPDLNDPALKAKVESQLFSVDDVPKERISVGVADGVVTLRGELDSAGTASAVASAAEGIDGVRRVENLLTVAS